LWQSRRERCSSQPDVQRQEISPPPPSLQLTPETAPDETTARAISAGLEAYSNSILAAIGSRYGSSGETARAACKPAFAA
jgi:hypothetical protein